LLYVRPNAKSILALLTWTWLLGCIHLTAAFAQPQNASSLIVRFVATNGNDRWSGRFAQPTTDGSDGPFATLERARDSLRESRKDRGA